MAPSSRRDRTVTGAASSPCCNLVVLAGSLSRPPEVRVLPSGDCLVAYEVTTRPPDGPALTVPVTCAAPGAPVELEVGDDVVVTGVVRRRYFRAGGGTQSRTEVVADAVISARQVTRARRAVERAMAAAVRPV